MNNHDLPNNVIKSRELVLDYKNQKESELENAISIINKYEKPEYSEYDRMGEDASSSGFFQVYHYKNIGLLIQKKDSKIINVENKK